MQINHKLASSLNRCGLKNEGNTSGFIRPSETADDRVKQIGQQISATKSLYYSISNSSFETETNISRLVFTEPYHGNFKTAFGQDGLSDHTGIVQKVENGKVYTVEGNSGDSCRVNEYSIGYYEILGYGAPAY